MLKPVVVVGDVANGHTDIQGNTVQGVVVSGSFNSLHNSSGIANSECVVHFSSHPHAIVSGNPTDYKAHDVNIVSSGRHNVNNFKIARGGDSCNSPCGDATLLAATKSLYCEG